MGKSIGFSSFNDIEMPLDVSSIKNQPVSFDSAKFKEDLLSKINFDSNSKREIIQSKEKISKQVQTNDITLEEVYAETMNNITLLENAFHNGQIQNNLDKYKFFFIFLF